MNFCAFLVFMLQVAGPKTGKRGQMISRVLPLSQAQSQNFLEICFEIKRARWRFQRTEVSVVVDISRQALTQLHRLAPVR